MAASDLDTARYLDPRTLAAIGSLELRARMIIEGLMTGLHRSPHFGFSVEFAQHRQYVPGDDIRHLDWKVYGRTNKLYLKQFQKETNLDLLILVDNSGSMAYGSMTAAGNAATGTWRKFDHASAIAATLAYLALQQQDRVGLVLFSDRVSRSTRVSDAHDHWRSILEALASAPPQADTALVPDMGVDHTADGPISGRVTDLGRLFDQVAVQLARRSLILLISDLFDRPEALERGLARLHHLRHDVILFQTLDPAELTFPFRSATEFAGLEGEGRLPLDAAALRRAYLAAIGEHLRRVEQMARRFRFDYLLLNTARDVGAPLSRFLARRAALMSKGK